MIQNFRSFQVVVFSSLACIAGAPVLAADESDGPTKGTKVAVVEIDASDIVTDACLGQLVQADQSTARTALATAANVEAMKHAKPLIQSFLRGENVDTQQIAQAFGVKQVVKVDDKNTLANLSQKDLAVMTQHGATLQDKSKALNQTLARANKLSRAIKAGPPGPLRLAYRWRILKHAILDWYESKAGDSRSVLDAITKQAADYEQQIEAANISLTGSKQAAVKYAERAEKADQVASAIEYALAHEIPQEDSPEAAGFDAGKKAILQALRSALLEEVTSIRTVQAMYTQLAASENVNWIAGNTHVRKSRALLAIAKVVIPDTMATLIRSISFKDLGTSNKEMGDLIVAQVAMATDASLDALTSAKEALQNRLVDTTQHAETAQKLIGAIEEFQAAAVAENGAKTAYLEDLRTSSKVMQLALDRAQDARTAAEFAQVVTENVTAGLVDRKISLSHALSDSPTDLKALEKAK